MMLRDGDMLTSRTFGSTSENGRVPIELETAKSQKCHGPA